MASSGGYDLNWVEDPPDDLKCLICLAVARNPQQHPGDDSNDCGKVFCLECITEYQKNYSKCPNCHQKLILFKDAKSARTVNALKVKCNRNSNNCDWTGELGSLETHCQKSCGYALLPCTNQCKIGSIVSTFSRKDLDHHLATDCPKRQHKCPHCKEMGEHQERTTTHLETCPNIRVNCPNTDCRSRVLRCNIATHLTTCKYESVACKYAAVGCEDRPSRRELKEHEEDALLHLQITTEKNLELTQKVELLASDVLKSKKLLTKVDSRLTFKLTNYQEHKNNNIFSSPSFYTSCSGYKLCLSVCANGQGRGSGSHVSVYACLMKGYHDDTLTWPFTGSVTTELLNQLEDKNHYRVTLTFSADQEASKRVMDRERGIGWGWPKFISHTFLDYNASANTQYLKNDTLVFRVSAEIPDHKPWLECTL